MTRTELAKITFAKCSNAWLEENINMYREMLDLACDKELYIAYLRVMEEMWWELDRRLVEDGTIPCSRDLPV